MSQYITKYRRSCSGRINNQRAMTLVELLIAMVIISFLASILLGAAAVAGETAREARTKQLVTRLHALLLERYDSYRSRRIDANFDGTGQVLAAQRLHVLRTTMQMEMPDRWSDILNAQPNVYDPNNLVSFVLYNANASGSSDNVEIPRTSLNQLYLRQYAQLTPPDPEALLLNQSAECLYLTIMYGTAEGEARGLFKENVIGDTDGDGALEFLDGWGNPIRFLRWAKGYDNYSDLQSEDGALSHDPFDIYRVDSNLHRESTDTVEIATKLVPLIYSAGPDEEYGMATTIAGSIPAMFGYSNVQLNGINRGINSASGETQLILDPYSKLDVDGDGSGDAYVGTPVDSDEYGVTTLSNLSEQPEQHVDNLTNHQITAR